MKRIADPQPFGHYSPGIFGRIAISFSRHTGNGVISRRLRSLCYRLAGGKAKTPRDMVIFDSQRARLHPYDNLSEKRVFVSDAHWEKAERAFLSSLMERDIGPFHFVDVGANAGLYTLAARALAQEARRPFFASVIEPQPVMLERLRFNLSASGTDHDVTVFPWAATDQPGKLTFETDGDNLGQGRLGEGSLEVEGRPLAEAVQNFQTIDALKIDIEGAERPALEAFFNAAPKSQWPTAIIIEAGRGDLSLPGPALCLERGYSVSGTTKMNALLELSDR